MTNPIARIERHDYRDPLGHPLAGSVDWKAITQADKARGEFYCYPAWAHGECLEVLRNVDTQFRATGQVSARIERLINLLAGITPQPQGDASPPSTVARYVKERVASEMAPFYAHRESKAGDATPQARPDGGEAVAEIPSGHPTSVVRWLKPMPPAGTKLYTHPAPAPDVALVEYEFEVWQDGEHQAGGTTTTLEAAQGEADHYALMYGQDGPVEVKIYERRGITTITQQQGATNGQE